MVYHSQWYASEMEIIHNLFSYRADNSDINNMNWIYIMTKVINREMTVVRKI